MAMNLGPMSHRRAARRAPMADINVTPFVDVMLVLLIIFMVTAPLLTSGVPVDLPETDTNALDQQQDPVSISIDGDGRVYMDEEPLDQAQFEARLTEIARTQDPENPRQIMLRGDRSLDYGLVMAVMGALNRAGLNRVALVTTSSSESDISTE